MIPAALGNGFRSNPATNYSQVVKPYIDSNDIANDPLQRPSRWVIDFGLMSLEEAMAFPVALDIVRREVKPIRDKDRNAGTREKWWLFSRPRPALRAAVEGLDRYLVVGKHGKRLLFTWAKPSWCPSNATSVIAVSDDWSFGVLTSSIHERWAREHGSTLEDRLRYTADTTFENFPFPERKTAQHSAIEHAVRDVERERVRACGKLIDQGKKGRSAGLTAVYNAMDDGAFVDLRAAHKRLDEAVCRSYGWPTSILDDRTEIVERLYELNAKIAANPSDYVPFTQGEGA